MSCEARPAAALEARQNVHQIHVPPMKAAQVIAVPEALIGVPHFPIAGGGHAVQQTAIVQHRQIEARAVPGHQVRRVLVQPVEKSLDQILLRGGLIAEAPHLQRFPGAHDHGDRDDALLFVREKFAAGLLPALGEHDLRHVLIGQIVQAVQPPAQIRVRAPSRCRTPGYSSCARRMSMATATTSPASSVKVTWPSPIPRPSRTLAPRSE